MTATSQHAGKIVIALTAGACGILALTYPDWRSELRAQGDYDDCAFISDFDERNRCVAEQVCSGIELRGCMDTYLGTSPVPAEAEDLATPEPGDLVAATPDPDVPVDPSGPFMGPRGFAFEQGRCAAGFAQVGGVCIELARRGALPFLSAQISCRVGVDTARIATSLDYAWVFELTTEEAAFDPRDLWLGERTGDDRALFGNRAITRDGDRNIVDFDGEDDASRARQFRCAYDLLPVAVLPPP